MKKILILTPKFYPSIGGIEEQVKLLWQEFLKLWYKVDILTYKKGREKSEEMIFNMNIFTFDGFLDFYKFFRTHKDYKCIISRQYYKMSFFLGILKFLGFLKSKTIIVGDGGTKENEITLTQKQLWLFSRLFFYFVWKNNFLIWNNADFMNSLKSIFPKKKIKKIYNGIDWKSNKNKINKIENILFLSRFDEWKWHRETIQAFKKIENKNIKLYIVWYGDNNEEEKIKKLIKKDNRIIFYGKAYWDEKEKLIKNMDLFIFPSYYKWESFGMVLFEMAQKNIPIITTDFADTKELFWDNVLYVKKQNIQDLQEKIEWMIENIENFNYDYSKVLDRVDIKKIAQIFLKLK